MSLSDIRVTPKLTGIYRRKEKRKAVSCFIPSNIAATMVMPDRLIPGKRAMDCAKPTMIASLSVICWSFLDPRKFLIIQRAIPVSKREKPITFRLLEAVLTNGSNVIPMAPVTLVATSK